MRLLKGIPVSPGIGEGKATLIETQAKQVSLYKINKSQVAKEIKRWKQAVDLTIDQISKVQATFAESAGVEYSSLFDAHIQILKDPSFLTKVEKRIKEQCDNAANAVHKTTQDLIEIMTKFDDDYLSQRTSDIADIEKRILDNLSQTESKKGNNELSGIIIAHNLEPSQTALMDPKKILGIVTETGGPTSHTAIMARALNIPAVVGIDDVTKLIENNQRLIVDGNKGIAVLEPSKELTEQYKAKKRTTQNLYRSFEKEVSLPTETLDGREIAIRANIEFPSEIPSVVRYGAEGIGLYRTEFLIMNKKRKDVPEEAQVRTYEKALKDLNGQPLTIRTFDLGGDKASALTISYGVEANPFLGCRSLRFCFENPKQFTEQLRAILKASASGNLKLLLPMVSDKQELIKAKGMIETAKEQLRSEGADFNENIPIGIMMEVPSAIVIADTLADEVDFFSIGTNDLVQYTIAVDRGNEKIAHMYIPHNPAILRMLKQTIEVGERYNTPVSICGEMAADINYTNLLIGLGAQELSVIASTIPQIKRIIRSINYYEARDFAEHILSLNNHVEIKKELDLRNQSLLPKTLRAS